MELRQESSKFGATSSNLSSSSSAFVSAIQSPFLSPRSPCEGTESLHPDIPNALPTNPSSCTISEKSGSRSVGYAAANISPAPVYNWNAFRESTTCDHAASSIDIIQTNSSSRNKGNKSSISQPRHIEKQKKWEKSQGKFSYTRVSAPLSFNKRRIYDVYIGYHGRKPSLLKFSNWLRAELEVQGVTCFAADRARFRNSRSHDIVERAINVCSFGVVILTKKSFGNPYSIEELRSFLSKKNLVPIFFDLGPGDCLARDIIEKRGEIWEKHGGELWELYGGLEKEWKEAIDGLSRVDEWKLEAQDGNWRDCILRAVVQLATKLGRRFISDRVTSWREKVEKDEFPFPRNENFVGRKKELSELELILFGDISGDAEKEYIELKTRHRQKSLVISQGENSRKGEELRDQHTESSSNKGKEPVVWKESEKEIEMQRVGSPQCQSRTSWGKNFKRYGRRKRSMKILYGRGIACVSGDPGIGKTELLLEFAYRFSQRYKMVLWIGGASRYIRQNYLNLLSFLDIDMRVEGHFSEKSKIKSFEDQEETAISRVRKELMREIPFLVVIDNLESEKDWWDQKMLMDLLPRFGCQTHFLISTRLPRIMNLEPLKLSYLSEMEAMSLMKGNLTDYPIPEIDALRIIEGKLGRLTIGLGIVGAILSELPINPSRLLDTINRIPLRDITWSGKEGSMLRRHTFLLQLLEVCFSIFDHADGPRSLATRMVQVSGWFAPAAIPISLLALAARKVPEKHKGTGLWKRCWQSLTCGATSTRTKRSEAEASSMLVRFSIARSGTKPGFIQFNELIKSYARKRGTSGVSQAMVQAISSRGFISQHSEHLWAACFLLFRFETDPPVVELKVDELLVFVRQVVLPLAIHTFFTFSRCSAALELLRLCSDALEAGEESLVARAEKWLDKSLCWKSVQSNAQLNPYLWHELALLRATVLETRVKLMSRGGQYDIGDELIRKALFIRTSILGEHHPDTVATREILSKVTRLLTNVQGR